MSEDISSESPPLSGGESAEWQTLVDPRSKREYYVNSLTKQTTWTNPNALQTSEWVQYADSKGRYYYMNKITRLSSWTKPVGFDEEAFSYAHGKGSKARMAAKEEAEAKRQKAQESEKPTWSRHIDKVTGQPYWTDGRGNITTTNPDGKDEEIEDEGTAAEEEEVWSVPLNDIESGSYTQEKIDKLMNLVESSVVKDISEIKDFSAKKLQEYLRTIQTIISRKRNSYFIAKNLRFIQEIVDRNDPQVLKHFSDSYTLRIFTEVLNSPHKPTVVAALLQTLLKACKVNVKFRHKIRMECQFWDCVFDAIKVVAGDTSVFQNVYTLVDAPKKGSSSSSTSSNATNSRNGKSETTSSTVSSSKRGEGEGTSETSTISLSAEEEEAVKEAGRLSLDLLEVLLDDPMVLNAVREYGCIRDLVECCRSHDRKISSAAMAVLERLVDNSDSSNPRLNLLMEGQYDLNELLSLVKSKVPHLVCAALENLRQRIEIMAFASARDMPVNAVTAWGYVEGKCVDAPKPKIAYLVVADGVLYAYQDELAPYFKLNLRDGCIARRENMSDRGGKDSVVFAFSTLIEEGKHVEGSNASSRGRKSRRKSLNNRGQFLVTTETQIRVTLTGPTNDAEVNTEKWFRRVNDIIMNVRSRRLRRPMSSYGQPVLQTIRQRSSQRNVRRDVSKSSLREAPPSHPENKAPLFSMFKSHSRVSAKVSVEEPKLLNFQLSHGIRWADLGPQIPFLLQMASRSSAMSESQQQAAVALECVRLALCTGSPHTMLTARETVVNDGDYNYLSIMANIVRRSSDTADASGSSATMKAETAAKILDSQASLLNMAPIGVEGDAMSPAMRLLRMVARCMTVVMDSQHLAVTDERLKHSKRLAADSSKALVTLLSAEKIMLLISALIVNNRNPEALFAGLRLGVSLCEAGQREALLRSGLVRVVQFQTEPAGNIVDELSAQTMIANVEANLYISLGQNALSHLPVVVLIDLLRSTNTSAIVEATRSMSSIVTHGLVRKANRPSSVARQALPALLLTAKKSLIRVKQYSTSAATVSVTAGASVAHTAKMNLQIIHNVVLTLKGLSRKVKYQHHLFQRGGLKTLIQVVGCASSLYRAYDASEALNPPHVNEIILLALDGILNMLVHDTNKEIVRRFDAGSIMKLMSTLNDRSDDKVFERVFRTVTRLAEKGGKATQRLLFQCQVPLIVGAVFENDDKQGKGKSGKKKQRVAGNVIHTHPHMLAAWCKVLSVLSENRQSANQLIKKGGVDTLARMLTSHRSIVQSAALSALTNVLRSEEDLICFVLRSQSMVEDEDEDNRIDPIAELGFHVRSQVKSIHDEAQSILVRIVRSKSVLAALDSRQLFSLINVRHLIGDVTLTSLSELGARLMLGVTPSFGSLSGLPEFHDTLSVRVALGKGAKAMWLPHHVILRRPFLYLYRMFSSTPTAKAFLPPLPTDDPACKFQLIHAELLTDLLKDRKPLGFHLKGKWGGSVKLLADSVDQKTMWCVLLTRTIDELSERASTEQSSGSSICKSMSGSVVSAPQDSIEHIVAPSTPLPSSLQHDQVQDVEQLHLDTTHRHGLENSTSSGTLAEFLLDVATDGNKSDDKDVSNAESKGDRQSRCVLLNVGKLRRKSALSYENFLSEQAISKLTSLVQPSTDPALILRLARILCLLTTRFDSTNETNIFAASSVIGTIIEIVVLYNDTMERSGASMICGSGDEAKEAENLSKDAKLDTRAIRSAVGKLEKKIISQAEFDKVCTFIMEAALQRKRKHFSREETTSAEISAVAKKSSVAPPSGLYVERVFMRGARELASRLSCRLGRLYLDGGSEGGNDDVLIGIFGPSQFLKPSKEGENIVYTDPTWYDVRHWTARHVVRKAFQFEKIYGFQTPLRCRFLRSFERLSPQKVAQERTLRKRARDYAMEALANITDPHSPFCLPACEHMMIYYGQWNVSLIGKEVSQDTLMIEGGRNMLRDILKMVNSSDSRFSSLSYEDATSILEELTLIMANHATSSRDCSDDDTKTRSNSVSEAHLHRMRRGTSVFPMIDEEGSGKMESLLRKYDVYCDKMMPKTAMSTMTRAFSLIVNHLIHNSRSIEGRDDDAYSFSSTFVSDCADPQSGLVRTLRRVVAFIMLSVYRDLVPDPSKTSIVNDMHPALGALIRSVLHVYSALSLANPSEAVKRAFASQGMLFDISFLWFFARGALSDAPSFRSAKQLGFLGKRVAGTLEGLFGRDANVTETLSVNALVWIIRTPSLAGAAIEAALGLSSIVNSPKRKAERNETVKKALPSIMHLIDVACFSDVLGPRSPKIVQSLVGLCLALSSDLTNVDDLIAAGIVPRLLSVACWSNSFTQTRDIALQTVSLFLNERKTQIDVISSDVRLMHGLNTSVVDFSIENLPAALKVFEILSKNRTETCERLSDCLTSVIHKIFSLIYPQFVDTEKRSRSIAHHRSSRAQSDTDRVYHEKCFLRSAVSTLSSFLENKSARTIKQLKEDPIMIRVLVKLLASPDLETISGSLRTLTSLCNDHLTKQRVIRVHGMKGLNQIIKLTHGRSGESSVDDSSRDEMRSTRDAQSDLPPIPPSPGAITSPTLMSGVLSDLARTLLKRISGTDDDGISVLHTSANVDELFALTRSVGVTIVRRAAKALADRVSRGLHPTASTLLMPDKVGFLWRKSSTMGMTTWRMRWIMLKDGYLYEYKGRDGNDGKNLRRKICLSGCTVASNEILRDKIKCFTLTLPNDGGEMIMGAVRNSATNKWLKEIRIAIRELDRGNRAGKSLTQTPSAEKGDASTSTRRGLFGPKGVLLLNMNDGETFSPGLFTEHERLEMLSSLCDNADPTTAFQASRIFSHLLQHFEDDREQQASIARKGVLALLRFVNAGSAESVKSHRSHALEALCHFAKCVVDKAGDEKKLSIAAGKNDRFGVGIMRNALIANMAIPTGREDIKADDSCMYCNTKITGKSWNCSYCKQYLCEQCAQAVVWDDNTNALRRLCNYCFRNSSRIQLPALRNFINCEIGRQAWTRLCRENPMVVNELNVKRDKDGDDGTTR